MFCLQKMMDTLKAGIRLKWFAVAVALSISCLCAAGATEHPNFILILTDDQGYNDLGCFGSERIKTPNTDRMAAEGMKFTDFYATSPICTPTRASIMTGCYPSRVGLGTPLHTTDTIGLNEDEITLAELLKSQAYATACIGKWHLGHHPEFYPTRHGFDYYYGTPLGHCFLSESMRKRGDYSDLFLRNEEKVPFPPIEDLTEVLTAEAVKWIKANKDNPFFLFLTHPMPHGPVAASERFRGKSAGGLYGDAVETIDWSTGEIIKTIKELGLSQDTIVVFASDNGADKNPWGTKATWFGSNAPFRGKKQEGWEGGLRVPCVMWGPGRIPAGSVCSEIATVMDFLPTFGAMAGAELPTDRMIDGKNITSLMLGEKGATTPYDAFVYHVRFGKRSGVRMGDWKVIVDVDAQTWKHKGTALYNLKKDPGETRNCAAEHPEKVKELKERLDTFNSELDKTKRPAGIESEKPLQQVPFSAKVKAYREDRPNVVILFADDLGYGDLGCYGARGYTTPHLDGMAREGMRFTDFYVAAPVCSASRGALMTGRYPIRTGVTGVISANTKNHLPLAEVTLAERFKAIGYATAIFGKWHLGNTPDVWPLKQGFDEWFGTVGSNDMGKGRPSLEARRAGKAGVELVEQDKVIEINPDQRLLTRRYTDRAVDFIGRKKTEPFFLYVPYNMPHTPLFASERFAGKSERGLYGDVITEIDWSVGEILKALKSAGIDDRTIVLFSSDNGPWLIFGDHGGSAGPLSGGKKQTLEGGLRVPMVVRWPGHVPEGQVNNMMVTSLDLTPTLVAMTGATNMPKEIDGRDISALLLGGENKALPDKFFFYFWERELRAVRQGRWKLQLPHVDTQAPDPAGIGNGGVRGQVMKVSREQALYDLRTDPGETKNVASQHPEKVKELRVWLKAFEQEQRPGNQ